MALAPGKGVSSLAPKETSTDVSRRGTFNLYFQHGHFLLLVIMYPFL